MIGDKYYQLALFPFANFDAHFYLYAPLIVLWGCALPSFNVTLEVPQREPFRQIEYCINPEASP
jgi:hypothetical protein